MSYYLTSYNRSVAGDAGKAAWPIM